MFGLPNLAWDLYQSYLKWKIEVRERNYIWQWSKTGNNPDDDYVPMARLAVLIITEAVRKEAKAVEVYIDGETTDVIYIINRDMTRKEEEIPRRDISDVARMYFYLLARTPTYNDNSEFKNGIIQGAVTVNMSGVPVGIDIEYKHPSINQMINFNPLTDERPAYSQQIIMSFNYPAGGAD